MYIYITAFLLIFVQQLANPTRPFLHHCCTSLLSHGDLRGVRVLHILNSCCAAGYGQNPTCAFAEDSIPHGAMRDQTEFHQCHWDYSVFLPLLVWKERRFLLHPATSLGALAALWTPWPNLSPEPVPHRGSVEKLVLFTITLPGGSHLCLVVFGLMTGQQEGKDATQPTLFMLHFKFFLLFIVEVLMLT